jgi:hypothetical protein
MLSEETDNPTKPSIFANFLKACRRLKDPKAIAKEYTMNIKGLITLLEENVSRTKDYNLRRRMKRAMDLLRA